MKVINLPKQQVVIEGNVEIPRNTTTLVGYKHKGKPIAQGKVLGYFSCSSTKITSLEQGPSWVGGDFYCWNTKITSLEGGPSYVGDDFDCSGTNVTSLHNIHKQIKHIGGTFYISNTVRSYILGVMLIKGLQRIQFYNSNIEQVQVAAIIAIINKHLAGDRNVHLAQEELIEAGLSEFAKL